MSNKISTMKDVAALAKVSVQTVSCVVNNKSGITKETQLRVLDAIKVLGYRPYHIARSLRTRETQTIALVVSDISNPSFSNAASAAEDYAHSFGYNLSLYNTHDDIEREAQYIRMATDRWVDGVIFVSAKDHMNSLQTLMEAKIPSVAIDRVPEQYRGPSVTLDNIKAGYIAADHLLKLGHRCIAHINGPLSLKLSRERLAGFHQAVEEWEGTTEVSMQLEGNWECEAGYKAMLQLLDHHPRPTGIFSANDRMAIGAIRAIYEAGLTVPEDISVVGLDDIEVSSFIQPPLTTVHQSFAEMATLGIQILLELLSGRKPETPNIVLEPLLIVRKSTCPHQKTKVNTR